MNRERLEALAHHLINDVPQEKFDMDFFAIDEVNFIGPEEAHTCMTVGCALGHATTLFPASDRWYSWGGYCYNTLGINPKSREYDWCFSCDWAETDNTPAGAGRRILQMLESGVPDEY